MIIAPAHFKSVPVNSRFEIETSVIGAILVESSYVRVADILRPNNFTDWAEKNPAWPVNYQLIYSVIQELYPGAIDMLTVSSAIQLKYGQELWRSYVRYLMNTTMYVVRATHLEFWAQILLQLDIREKAQRQLGLWLIEDKGEDKVLREAVHNIHQALDDTHENLFEILEKAPGYLQHMQAPEQLVMDLQQTVQQVDQRYENMMQRAQQGLLLRHVLSSVSPYDNVKFTTMQYITDIIRHVISAPYLTQDFFDKVTEARRAIA